MCHIPLGRIGLPPHLKGLLGVQGLRGISLDCSSSWSNDSLYEPSSFSDEVLGDSGFECFSLLVSSEEELSPSFFFPLSFDSFSSS